MTGAFHVIEVALGVGLQVHCELVEVFGDLCIVVEVLVEVGFAIVVVIDQVGDLVASQDKDLVVDDSQSQRLEESGGNAFPRQRAGGVVFGVERGAEPRDNPDISLPCADGRPTGVREVVESSQPHPASPRIPGWQCQFINRQGTF